MPKQGDILTYKEDMETEIFFQLRYERGDPELQRGLIILKNNSQIKSREEVYSPNQYQTLETNLVARIGTQRKHMIVM